MTMHDKAMNALHKARGTLDSAIGTVFGDEQLEILGTPDRKGVRSSRVSYEAKEPSKD